MTRRGDHVIARERVIRGIDPAARKDPRAAMERQLRAAADQQHLAPVAPLAQDHDRRGRMCNRRLWVAHRAYLTGRSRRKPDFDYEISAFTATKKTLNESRRAPS